MQIEYLDQLRQLLYQNNVELFFQLIKSQGYDELEVFQQIWDKYNYDGLCIFVRGWVKVKRVYSNNQYIYNQQHYIIKEYSQYPLTAEDLEPSLEYIIKRLKPINNE